MSDRVTIPKLQQMERDGEKIVGVVVWDYQMARIADKVGVEIMSVGDSVGVNLWGQPHPLEVTLEQMISHFEEGQKLLGLCGKKLNEVERRIEILVRKGDEVAAEPFGTALR